MLLLQSPHIKSIYFLLIIICHKKSKNKNHPVREKKKIAGFFFVICFAVLTWQHGKRWRARRTQGWGLCLAQQAAVCSVCLQERLHRVPPLPQPPAPFPLPPPSAHEPEVTASCPTARRSPVPHLWGDVEMNAGVCTSLLSVSLFFVFFFFLVNNDVCFFTVGVQEDDAKRGHLRRREEGGKKVRFRNKTDKF